MKKIITFSAAFLICLQLFSTPESPTSIVYMRSNLYVLGTGGDTTLMDGDLTQYDPSFSNAIDGMDARKMSNPGENIGLQRGNVTLAIERRQTIQNADSIFLKIWNLNSGRHYQLQLIALGMTQPGLSGYLQDLYLNTITPVSLEGTTYTDFGINADPASYNPMRFRVIFSMAIGGALPITFTSINAYQQDNSVHINWKTATESNMKEYTVERSSDGINFTSLGSLQADNLPVNNYNYLDQQPDQGNNFYRIASIGIDGNTKLSSVMKVFIGSAIATMKVFPNPVVGNMVNLQLNNYPQGNYTVRFINSMGQTVLSKQIQHPGGNSTQSIDLPSTLPHGMYRLEIIGDSNTRSNAGLLY